MDSTDFTRVVDIVRWVKAEQSTRFSLGSALRCLGCSFCCCCFCLCRWCCYCICCYCSLSRTYNWVFGFSGQNMEMIHRDATWLVFGWSSVNSFLLMRKRNPLALNTNIHQRTKQLWLILAYCSLICEKQAIEGATQPIWSCVISMTNSKVVLQLTQTNWINTTTKAKVKHERSIMVDWKCFIWWW